MDMDICLTSLEEDDLVELHLPNGVSMTIQYYSTKPVVHLYDADEMDWRASWV